MKTLHNSFYTRKSHRSWSEENGSPSADSIYHPSYITYITHPHTPHGKYGLNSKGAFTLQAKTLGFSDKVIVLIEKARQLPINMKKKNRKKKKHLWTFYILFNPPICVTYIYVWPVALKTTVNYSCLCSLPCKHMQSSDKLCAHTHSSPKKQIFFFKASKQQWFHTGFSIRVLMVVLKTAHFSNWAVFCSVNGPQTAPSYGMVERRLRQSTLLFIG